MKVGLKGYKVNQVNTSHNKTQQSAELFIPAAKVLQ